MKKIFTLLFVVAAVVSHANNYYLSPNGNNNNNGSISSPWFTMSRAWTVVQPGDTVFMRNGTYAYTDQDQCYLVGKNGTAGNLIVIMSYPGETATITKGPGYQNNDLHWRGGVFLTGNYIKMYKLIFTGFEHGGDPTTGFIWRGLYMENSNFCVIEQCVSHDNEYGFNLQDNSKGNLFLNCDAYNNWDINTGGGNADGFGWGYLTVNDPSNPNVARGCRSWWNGDDGFDGWHGSEVGGVVVFDSCWSWFNGWFRGTFNQAGNGEGFKMGGGDGGSPGVMMRYYKNCVSFHNRNKGFEQNNLNGNGTFYNCIAVDNGNHGININQNNSAHVIRNCVSLDNNGDQFFLNVETTASNNSSDDGSSGSTNNASSADFGDYDISTTHGNSQLGAARKADGSLPDITFLHLASGSDLIDAGTPVGIGYNGANPDRGAFETGGTPPPNQPPIANAGANKNITLPTNSITQTGNGSDPDGSIVSFLWTKISGPASFTIVSPNAAQTVINNLVQGVYQFQLTVTDNAGASGSDIMQVTVNAAPVNQLPTANAGPNHSITLPTNSLTATGSGSDPDGSIASYQWNKIAGPAQFVIISPTLAQTVINNLVQGVYQFELTVTDNIGATDRDTMIVTVNPAAPPANQPPTANAGTNHTITLPVNSVTASGSGSDPDGSISAYLWTKIAGPASFNIVSPNSASTIINNLVQGVYQFELRVTDNNGAFGRDTMVVTVNPAAPPANQPPTANAGTNHTITLPVNSVTASGSGSDPDGSISAYLWTKIAGPASFNIVSPNSASTIINNLVQGVYQFELRVTDNNGAFGRDTMVVTVNPAAPPANQPPTANAGTNHTITLPVNSVTASGSGSDPDGSISAYLWTKIAGPASFNIVSPNSASTIINNLVQGVYQFELRVTDNNGAFGRDTMVVTVNPAAPPANQPPTANAGTNHTITLPVNSVTASGSGSDPDGSIASYQWNNIAGPASYSIVSPNQAQSVLDNLVEGVYLFELVVTDNNNATARDTVQITVLQNQARTSTAIVYPNPATTVINIQIDAITYSNKTLISIFNVTGVPVYRNEVMRTQQSTTVPIDVSRFPAGSYFINISVDINNSITLPFVKF